MEASELMIGNWVYDEVFGAKNFPHQVGGRDFDSADIFKPIPLTEGWLIKFGFEKDAGGQFILNLNYKHLNGRLMYSDFCTMSVFSDFSDGRKEDYTFQRDIVYVHQLQNLYFDLTGKELKIKE